MRQIVLLAMAGMLLVNSATAVEKPAEIQKISATELVSGFVQNQAFVDETLGKTLDVTGTLYLIGRSDSKASPGSQFVMQLNRTEVPGFPGTLAVFYFPKSAGQQLAQLKQNDVLTIRGVCQRAAGGASLQLNQCTLIVEASASPNESGSDRVGGSPVKSKWEFKVLHEIDEKTLNQLGAEGWELTSIVTNELHRTCILKRKLERK